MKSIRSSNLHPVSGGRAQCKQDFTALTVKCLR